LNILVIIALNDINNNNKKKKKNDDDEDDDSNNYDGDNIYLNIGMTLIALNGLIIRNSLNTDTYHVHDGDGDDDNNDNNYDDITFESTVVVASTRPVTTTKKSNLYY
jgi:hypothetical protein